MAVLALSAAWPCTVLCAVLNCRKVSDPQNQPMLIRLQPYDLLSHTPANCGCAFFQEHKQKEADAHSQLMPKFHFQTELVGCSPTRIPRNAWKCQHHALNPGRTSKGTILQSWDQTAPPFSQQTQPGLGINIQSMMWFQLCKVGLKSEPGIRELAPDVFVFPLNVGGTPHIPEEQQCCTCSPGEHRHCLDVGDSSRKGHPRGRQ